MKRKPKKTKLEAVPVDSIKSNTIVNRDFPEPILNRIRTLWERVKGYAPYKTLEQWELSFMRDTKPEGEIVIWEKIADAVDEAEEELGLDDTIVFSTVLSYSMAMIKPADRAKSPTKEIVAVCKRVGLVPTPLQVKRR